MQEEFISISISHFEELLQLEKFFEYSQDLLCIATFDGFFKKINPAVSKVLGYSEEELYANRIMKFVHPEDVENTVLFRVGMITGYSLYNHENRYITKSGEIVWLSWTSIPIESNKCVFAIAKVITDKKKIEQERNALLDSISVVNQELKHFTRISSHDLRSPVNNILSIFDLLDISKITDPDTLELINLLKSTTHQLHQTLETYINELIRKDNEFKQPKNELNLEIELKSVVETISSLVMKSHTEIVVDFSAFKIIRFNKVFLDSILLNLITNAIKYASPDRHPLIHIKTSIKDNSRQLIIADNGLGIDLEKVKGKIFGLNQTFHRHVDSKGLGLYLVKTHINAMGGEIEVESEVGKGTTFIISFKD
ncbi:MAG: PAS domain-containing sensor histidine kinase [Sphingobacteriales bacterium]|nr:PAS domain-containing sensor histidine kinase [Sphingobacteriales bacterium]